MGNQVNDHVTVRVDEVDALLVNGLRQVGTQLVQGLLHFFFIVLVGDDLVQGLLEGEEYLCRDG